MSRRRRWIFGQLVLLTVAASCCHPAIHWRVRGWVRGEAFHDGRPTSYWKQEALESQVYGSILSGDLYFVPPEPNSHEVWLEKVFRIERRKQRLLSHCGPDALPMLLELLVCEEMTVQLYAIQALAGMECQALSAWPVLREMRRTTQEYLIFREASIALFNIDREASGSLQTDRSDEQQLFEQFKRDPSVK